MNRVEILRVKFDNLTKMEVLDRIENYLRSKEFHYIVTPNPEFILLAQKDNEFRQILNNADISIPDGTGVMKASRYLKRPLKERITGTDLIIDLMPIAEEKSYKIYLLGATPQVNEMTKQLLCYRHPNLKIVGSNSGPKFDIQDLDHDHQKFSQIIKEINDSGADLLIIAFGAPKQEKFIARFASQLNVRVAIGIGGALDYISGNVPRAPYIMRKFGLEWLFRLFLQPKRIGRIFNATVVFPLKVIFSKKC